MFTMESRKNNNNEKGIFIYDTGGNNDTYQKD